MDYSDIIQCRGCHAPAEILQPILTLEPMPLAGMFCRTVEEALSAPVFPISWVHCSQCGLVQVHEDISDQSLFSRYNYSSSSVPGLVRHFADYAKFLAERYSSPPIRFLEIGCNDGVLLNQLPKNWSRLGVDPSDVAAKAASKNDYELIPRPFSVATAEASKLESSLDVISGSNCLAHISDLRDVFQAAWLALRPNGHFWIEVHDLRALLQGGQWDTIYHEHKAEWSQESLTRCLELLGFTHKETIRTPMHGGALRSLFEKTGEPRRGANPSKVSLDEGLSKLNEAYQRRYETNAARQLLDAQRRGETIAAYGAAGRANVYLNQMSKIRFDYIVDDAPLRVNKFIPRVATPIVPSVALQQKPANACLITAWNYRGDIIRNNPQHKGAWLTAFQED